MIICCGASHVASSLAWDKAGGGNSARSLFLLQRCQFLLESSRFCWGPWLVGSGASSGVVVISCLQVSLRVVDRCRPRPYGLSIIAPHGEGLIVCHVAVLRYALHRLGAVAWGSLAVILSLVWVRSRTLYQHLRWLRGLIVSCSRGKLVLTLGSLRHASHTALYLSHIIHVSLRCWRLVAHSCLTCHSFTSHWSQWWLSLHSHTWVLVSLLLLDHRLQILLRRAHQRWVSSDLTRCLLLGLWEHCSLRCMCCLVPSAILGGWDTIYRLV